MSELLYLNNTAGSVTTITGSDVAIISGNLKPNQYNAVRISAYVEINTTATTVVQTNNLKLKIGTTVLRTIPFKSDAVARTSGLLVDWIGDASVGGAVSVTISGAGVDANTNVKAHNLSVISIQ